ncbi:MAG: SMP-30/gluconolactonase/LRE family protein [Cyanobacteria bacterium NC_groundwater_1444_Ag_S-0.65um_54_12]|nr:SMP-30/gluconolactonase/LRE family protein [Cyanobacteria bacterium NC_groundwater_1444_Ag_S-0.65um_54_12]
MAVNYSNPLPLPTQAPTPSLELALDLIETPANAPNGGIVSTLAGSAQRGWADGTSANARFNYPEGITGDPLGNLYVTDYYNHRIRRITPSGEVSTLAGSGQAGWVDGMDTSAQFNYPVGIASDKGGNLYVADSNNHRIRKITTTGAVSTVAGSGKIGWADGTSTKAQFAYPQGVAVDAADNLYVADYGNNRIRKITTDGDVTTLAGNSQSGWSDGNGAIAQFNSPLGITADSTGDLYVADYGNNLIRKITAGGTVSTLAGSGQSGWSDGVGMTAKFNYPVGLAVDGAGNVYVADSGNHRIRMVSPNGQVSTLVGTGKWGWLDASGVNAQFNTPMGIVIDTSGRFYITDTFNQRIRLVR